MPSRTRIPEAAAIGLALVFAVLSLYFFVNAMALITLEEPRVAASILASLIGLSLLSASVSLVRVILLSRSAEAPRRGGERESRPGSGYGK